eukprot:163879-Rhodomonas_salina.1
MLLRQLESEGDVLELIGNLLSCPGYPGTRYPGTRVPGNVRSNCVPRASLTTGIAPCDAEFHTASRPILKTLCGEQGCFSRVPRMLAQMKCGPDTSCSGRVLLRSGLITISNQDESECSFGTR